MALVHAALGVGSTWHLVSYSIFGASLILGQDEMDRGQIVVKDMATGVQKTIGQDDLEQALGFRKP